MEFSQLRYFVTIAEMRSFTKAAEALHITQPALSYQVKRLETELGTTLFDRSGRRIDLTPDGETFLPLAQGILFKSDEAIRLMKEHLGVEAGEVWVGANPSVGAFIMPAILASFRRIFPKVRVRMVEAGDAELERGIIDGHIDFAIVTGPSLTTMLDRSPLYTENLVLLLPTGHPLARQEAVSLRELADEPFVLTSYAFHLTSQVEEACRQAGFEPRIAYQAGSLESVKSFVRQGLGVAILPRLALGGPADGALVARPFREPLTRTIHLVRRRDRALTASAQALMIHVRTSLLPSAST